MCCLDSPFCVQITRFMPLRSSKFLNALVKNQKIIKLPSLPPLLILFFLPSHSDIAGDHCKTCSSFYVIFFPAAMFPLTVRQTPPFPTEPLHIFLHCRNYHTRGSVCSRATEQNPGDNLNISSLLVQSGSGTAKVLGSGRAVL